MFYDHLAVFELKCPNAKFPQRVDDSQCRLPAWLQSFRLKVPVKDLFGEGKEPASSVIS